MGLFEKIQARRDEIIDLAARHKARNVRIFGSAARGEGDEKSDVDFLVDFDADYRLFDHAGLVADLEDLLSRSVDVAPADRLRERVRERVLREARAL